MSRSTPVAARGRSNDDVNVLVDTPKGSRNKYLIGVPRTPVNRPQVRDLRELGTDCLHDIEHFFVSYNRAQGREFRILRRLGPRAAVRMLAAARRAFKQRNN